MRFVTPTIKECLCCNGSLIVLIATRLRKETSSRAYLHVPQRPPTTLNDPQRTREYDMQTSPEIFTPQMLSERLGIPVGTLTMWRKRGIGPQGFRAGKAVRYRRCDIEAWEARQAADDALKSA